MIRNIFLGSIARCLLAHARAGGYRQSAGRLQELDGLFDRHRQRHDLLCHVRAPRHGTQGRQARAIYLMVSDWPGRKVKAEPEIVPGYAYKPSAPVTLGIGGDRFNFFSRNDGARTAPPGCRI